MQQGVKHMKISNEDRINLLRIEEAKLILSNYLSKGIIKDKDLINLFNESDDYGISNNKKNSKKERMLKQVFNCPFLLCNQENLSKQVKELFPIFLQRRYNMELEELGYLLNNDSISYDEYLNRKKSLKLYYYLSSKDGEKILIKKRKY